MAAAFVTGKYTGGGASASTLVITKPTSGNVLAVFIVKTTEVTVAPKIEDNGGKGETGWTVNATFAKGNASAHSLWFATKVAEGTETELKTTGGTIAGLGCTEWSGASTTVDKIAATDNFASATTATTASYTSTDAGDLLLVCVGLASASGTITAWEGGPPTCSNGSGTTTARTIMGNAVPGEVISAKTFTAKWGTARAGGMLAVTLKPAGGEVKTVTAEVHGAGAATTPVAHGAIVNVADATGAGKITASVAHGASAVAKVDGAGAPTASVAHGAIVSAARVDGAGRATVTLAGAVVVTALVHGAGRATASVAHIGTATALVHGAGAPSVSAAGVRTATALVHGGGAVTASAAKVAPVVGSVHGAGLVSAAVAHGASATAKVTGGGSPRAVVSHTGVVSALVRGGGAATAYLALPAIIARVRGGGAVTVVLFHPTEQFPTKPPIEGHVALSRRGRLDRNKGHIANPRAGRSGT